jgi:hypothetical protein
MVSVFSLILHGGAAGTLLLVLVQKVMNCSCLGNAFYIFFCCLFPRDKTIAILATFRFRAVATLFPNLAGVL